MSNSSILSRLTALYDMLGAAYEGNDCYEAEAVAVSAGAQLVLDDIKDSVSQLNLSTSDGFGMSLYCQLFGIDFSLDLQKKRELISNGFKETYGSYQKGTFERELQEISPSLFTQEKKFEITIIGSVKDSPNALSKLGKTMKNYFPPCTTAVMQGEGFDFDYWDSTPFLFGNFDLLSLTFDFMETLN